MISRRSLITNLIAFTATAPAIVRAASLMPVKALKLEQSRELMIYESTAGGFNSWYDKVFTEFDQKLITTFCYMRDGSVVIVEHDK
jgi:hypothetical protein